MSSETSAITERDRSPIAREVATERHLVRVAGHRLGGGPRPAPGHDVDDVEDGEGADEGDREHEREHRRDPGQDHVASALPGIGAIDLGRVDEVRVDALEAGQEHHHAEPERRPDGGEQDGEQRGVRVAEPAPRPVAEAYRFQDRVQDPEQRVVDPSPYEPDDDDGQDHRDEVDRSEREAEPRARPQEDRQRQSDRDRGDRPDDRPDQDVRDAVPERAVVGERDVVVEPDEGLRRCEAVPGLQASWSVPRNGQIMNSA